MSHPATNGKPEEHDPAIIARVIQTRHELRESRAAIDRSVADLEARHAEAREERGSWREFADQARRACDAADAYRRAVRLHVLALVAVLQEQRNSA